MMIDIFKGIKIYVFGSAVYKRDPEDIDLLIEYNEEIIDINKAILLRKELAYYIENQLQIEADICLLNKTENNQTRFIQKEKGILMPLTCCMRHAGRLSASLVVGFSKICNGG